MNAREVIETLAVDYLWTDGTLQYGGRVFTDAAQGTGARIW